ncbi:MAG: HAMP domain-containing histidine kinase [Bacteroidales bacterium]|nr:HAMP domain-containing histidine kinase [Bacteroidales bacterium]
MKLRYRYQLFFLFGIIFLLFAAGVVIFEQSRAKRHKIEALEDRLNVYADVVNHAFYHNAPIDSLLKLFPDNIRLTLVNKQGQVFYDNVFRDIESMDNHGERPEIVVAKKLGQGSSMRESATKGIEFLYYAKSFEDYYVRVALPYDIQVKGFLRVDNGFLYVTLLLFLTALLFISFAAQMFGKSIRRVIVSTEANTHRIKQEITSNIAHELRTPVTSIRGYLETILEQSLDSEKQRQFISKAFSQTLSLSDLISDVGLLTKIENAPHSFHTDKVHILPVVESVCVDLGILLAENSIVISTNIPADTVVKGNENLLYSIFRNLTDNAIKYAGKGTTISIHRYNSDNDFHYFSFSDNGIGIQDEQHLSRIFERFYSVSEGRTRDTSGSGLGLSIVKNAIAFHKGTISVKNRAGGGLEFLFNLPVGIK